MLPTKREKRPIMKLSTATEILKAAGIEDARREARLLFSETMPIPLSDLLTADVECDSDRLSEAIARRAKREPLQYIIGEVDFYRERYKVTPDCLIPRSDTEILVDAVIQRLPKGAHFIDLCTGSGCIALSVLNNTDGTSAMAVDISASALNVAKENANRLSLSDRVALIEKDVLSEAVKGSFHAIVSNPPYVTKEAYKGLMPEIYFEPDIAFLGGDDGLDFYRGILELYKNSLSDGGFFAFEIGYDQADAIVLLAEKHLLHCEIINDYGGNARVAILNK